MLATSFTGDDAGVLAAVFVLLCFSAFLALAETGLVRTSKARARSLVEQNVRHASTLAQLVDDPEGFLAPVLLLVLICQLVASSLLSVVSAALFGALGVAIAIVFEIVLIFVAAEAVPKNWAVRNADRAALIAAPAVRWLIAFPPIRLVSSVLTGIAHVVLRVVLGEAGEARGPDVTESELLALADVAVEAEVIEKEERALMSEVIDFGDTVVREVMSPRPDVVAVSSTSTVEHAIDRALAENKSRLPVFAQSIDDIIGVVHVLDLVERLRLGEGARAVDEVVAPAHYVPETKRVAPLLRQMQAEQFHLAVVVDEYGGTAGVVTLEDLVEELVGEISDELDVEEPEVREADGGFIVSGKVDIDEVEELIGSRLPEGDYDTVAGLLLHLFGRVPGEGASTDIDGWRFVAARVYGRRIRTVRIERLPERSQEQSEAREASA